jgi:hypothetical protein
MHTMHVQARTRQRDFREIDAQLIVDLGTEVRTGVFMLTDSEADVLIAELSMLADPQDRTRYGMSAGEPERRIDGLRDAIVMVEGRTVITAFHKTAPYLRTDPRRDPHCRHRRQRREAEQRRRVFGHIVPL